MTAIPRCCSARHASSRSSSGIRRTVNLIFQPAEEARRRAHNDRRRPVRAILCDTVLRCTTRRRCGSAPPRCIRPGLRSARHGSSSRVRGAGGHAATSTLTASPGRPRSARRPRRRSHPGPPDPGQRHGGDDSRLDQRRRRVQRGARQRHLDRHRARSHRRRCRRWKRELAGAARGSRAAHGVACDVRFELLFPPTGQRRPRGRGRGWVRWKLILGADAVTRDMPPVTGSEDFGGMLERLPGAYVLLGTRASPTTRRCCAQPRL